MVQLLGINPQQEVNGAVTTRQKIERLLQAEASITMAGWSVCLNWMSNWRAPWLMWH